MKKKTVPAKKKARHGRIKEKKDFVWSALEDGTVSGPTRALMDGLMVKEKKHKKREAKINELKIVVF